MIDNIYILNKYLMKNFFWTTVFWLVIFFGFFGYLKWINKDLGVRLTWYIATQQACIEQQCTVNDIQPIVNTSGDVVPVLENSSTNVNTKLDEIKQQLKDINEKLDIQNSNAPDAVTVSLRTTKKTNIWIFPLDGSEYKKYVMQASDDILKDTLNLLFDNSPFVLKSTKLDSDGNLTITLERNRDKPFGGSAAVEQVRTSIEKTATQFSQIKSVNVMPEEVLQP